jgi:ubiquinone/menaquinone biosynthesis C-methylase UbiE
MTGLDTSIIQANIDVHTRMAAQYEQAEPHFRPENQAKVRRVLEQLRDRCGGGKLLDLGCGTGFLLRLAHDLFAEVHGVDVTPAMLARVDTTPGNIFLHNTAAEDLPFPDGTFDVVTAYSFLHHLEDHRRVLREAWRVLRPGGLFYADLEPNKLFWDQMSNLEAVPAAELPPWVLQARESVLATDARVEREYGIPQEVFRRAEYTKAILGGFDPRRLPDEARALGFGTCEVRLEWYVGQAAIMHGRSFAEAELIEMYLRDISPLSDHLFKYLRVVLGK